MLGKCGVCLRNKNLRFFFFLKMFACYVLSLKKHWKLWVSKLTAIFLLGCICSCHDSFFFYCKCLPYKSLKHILNVKFVFLQVFVFSNTCIAKEESVAFPMCCCSVYAVMINVNVYVFVLARLSFFFKKSIYVYEIHDVNFFFWIMVSTALLVRSTDTSWNSPLKPKWQYLFIHTTVYNSTVFSYH